MASRITPVQFETTNAPVEPDNWDNVFSGYFADQWRVGQRLTFNLGVRYDFQHSLRARTDAARRSVCRGGDVPARRGWQMGPLRSARGRGVGCDRQRQNGVKATYGSFNTEAAISANYNQYTTFQTVYRWSDPNRNGRYDPGEVDLNTTTAAGFHQHDQRGQQQDQRPISSCRMSTKSRHRSSTRSRRISRCAACTSSNTRAAPTAPSTCCGPYSAFNIPITRTRPWSRRRAQHH